MPQSYGCPPGLAKKNNGCLPPGQAKKLARGQRYAESYGYDRYAYNRIPYDLRQQYDLDPQQPLLLRSGQSLRRRSADHDHRTDHRRHPALGLQSPCKGRPG